MLKMSSSLDVSRCYCLWYLCISYTVSSKRESLDPCTAWKVEGTRSLALSAYSPPVFSTRFTVHWYKKGNLQKPCPRIEGCYSRLNCERGQDFPLGVIYSLFAPKASPLPQPPFCGLAPPPSDRPFFQQLLALLLCSLHRCAVLFRTSCPWTFPTHNFPNQSLAIKMSVRDGENWGEYLKRKREK